MEHFGGSISITNTVVEYDIRPSRRSQRHLSYHSNTQNFIAPKASWRNWFRLEWMEDIFLPYGYPDSVSPEYLTFQMWDTTQAMCSYLRGVLATQSVLESVGVGKDTVTPLAAAVNWVFRDGAGMLSGLAFTYVVGPRFDANVKFWRLYADLINNVGLTLDMLAPLMATRSQDILTLSAVCKAMCGIAAGSTRSSLTAHFAQHDNMADVAAKENSQRPLSRCSGWLWGCILPIG